VKPYFPGVEPPQPDPPQRSAVWDVVIVLVTISLAVLGSVKAPSYWAFFALAALVVASRFAGPTFRAVRHWRQRRHDERIARRGFANLQKFADLFARLINTTNTDTLQAALQKALERQQQALHIPTNHWFESWSMHLGKRLSEDRHDLPHLLRALDEFYSLVNAYSTECVQPVFQYMSADVRQLLTAGGRAALESFRERYVAFLDRYIEYTRDLAASLTQARFQPVSVFRPEQISV
jgi:hypothetical protein